MLKQTRLGDVNSAMHLFVLIFLLLVCAVSSRANWPMVRQTPQHNGFVRSEMPRSPRLMWAREFEGERIGTATEPIIDSGRVFIGTHAGNLWALDATDGSALWTFHAEGAFLNSPCVAEGLACAGSVDGFVYALRAATGSLAWKFFAAEGGFSAAPIYADGTIFVGTRSGDLLAITARSGNVRWRKNLGAAIRQTAAWNDGRVFLMAEDLRLRCFEASEGKLLWTSEQCNGQTALGHYPVIVTSRTRTNVIVRTNPIQNMAQQIGRDRGMLARNAGMDDSSWQKLDAWVKSDKTKGSAELWEREQQAIQEYLKQSPESQTAFVFDAVTGTRQPAPPILWVGGCQSVGPEPAQVADGRLLIYYRSAYGNWNHGVAPLVTLGLWDIDTNRIEPLFHTQGAQPPWNMFWGTADESQSFLTIGSTVLINHQGTLSSFDLLTRKLATLHGQRDSYGGLKNPPWARNEWHGPNRAGVAVDGGRIYWQSGSRILCLGGPGSGDPVATPITLKRSLASAIRDVPGARHSVSLVEKLTSGVDEFLAEHWAPLYVEPGLGGRNFFFSDSTITFEMLAWVYPHVPSAVQERMLLRLTQEWQRHPPFKTASDYPLDRGVRREPFLVPTNLCKRVSADNRSHPFSGVYAAWLYGERCYQQKVVLKAWPELKAAYADFQKQNWKLDPERGHLYANRYLAALLAFVHLAEAAGDGKAAEEARAQAVTTTDALVQWWKNAAERGTLKAFNTSTELDPFIGKGDLISFAVAPHRHKVALFQDLTPEVAALVKSKAPEAVEKVWGEFISLYPTWSRVGEERQVHFGENLIDPPDLAMNAFKALKWLRSAGEKELLTHADIPVCRADLFYLEKLSLSAER